jgi:hypothetical protein
MIPQPYLRRKTPKTQRTVVRKFLPVGLKGGGRGECGFADDAPGVGFRVVGLHGGEGGEATLLAGEACEAHCASFSDGVDFVGELGGGRWVCAVIV